MDTRNVIGWVWERTPNATDGRRTRKVWTQIVFWVGILVQVQYNIQRLPNLEHGTY